MFSFNTQKGGHFEGKEDISKTYKSICFSFADEHETQGRGRFK